MICAPSEDLDQPGHPPSLIRVFAVRMKNAWVLSYPLSAQRRLRSACLSAQSDQSFCHPHEEALGPSVPLECQASILMLFCTFCHAPAQCLHFIVSGDESIQEPTCADDHVNKVTVIATVSLLVAVIIIVCIFAVVMLLRLMKQKR